jgi:adenosylcobinamide-phosphate synthase
VIDPWLVLATAVVEAAIGYPPALHYRIPHPVTWIGKAIAMLEARWNDPAFSDQRRKALGIVCIVVLVTAAGAAGYALERLLLGSVIGGGLFVLIATVGLAQRSLRDHVAAVLHGLERGSLAEARAAVGHVVGRDVQSLTEEGVTTAALETLAESFNDGVIAPLFWFVVGGMPGLFAYKAVNTADSMIGHIDPRWKAFGWASARVDDVANYLPARLAGALICGLSAAGWRTMLRDASKHASPNAGWPEAAMAGTLGVRLGGPVTYDGRKHQRAYFGSGNSPTAAHLRHGLTIYSAACLRAWLCLAVLGVLWRVL